METTRTFERIVQYGSKDIFWIKVVVTPHGNIVETSLGIENFDFKKCKDFMLKFIYDWLFTVRKRHAPCVIDHFIDEVKKEKTALADRFFPDCVIDKRGKYCQDLARVLRQIEKEKNKEKVFTLKLLAPYSASFNSDIFYQLLGRSELGFGSETYMFEIISQTEFENELSTDELRNAYVEEYGLEMSFSRLTEETGRGLIMRVKEKVVLIFALEFFEFK